VEILDTIGDLVVKVVILYFYLLIYVYYFLSYLRYPLYV